MFCVYFFRKNLIHFEPYVTITEIPDAKENWKNFFPELDIIPVHSKMNNNFFALHPNMKKQLETVVSKNILKQKKSAAASYKNPFDYSHLHCTKSKNMLNNAKQSDIKNNKWTCMICSEVTVDKQSLIEHYDKHRIEKEGKSMPVDITVKSDYFVCPVCSKEFTSLKSYEKHVEMQHGEKRFTCEQCNKGFKNTFQLAIHNFDTHTTDGIYRCCACDFTTECRLSLKQHAQVHKEEHKFKCNICGKGFSSSTWYVLIYLVT